MSKHGDSDLAVVSEVEVKEEEESSDDQIEVVNVKTRGWESSLEVGDQSNAGESPDSNYCDNCSKLSDTVTYQKEEIVELKEELVEIKKERVELKQQLMKLQSQHKAQGNKIKELEGSLKVKASSIKTLEEQVEAANKNYEDLVTTKTGEFKNTLHSMRDMLNNFILNFDNIKQGTIEALDSLQGRVDGMGMDINLKFDPNTAINRYLIDQRKGTPLKGGTPLKENKKHQRSKPPTAESAPGSSDHGVSDLSTVDPDTVEPEEEMNASRETEGETVCTAEGCGKATFANPNLLLDHHVHTHNERYLNDSHNWALRKYYKGPYPCWVCGKLFKDLDQVGDHRYEVHAEKDSKGKVKKVHMYKCHFEHCNMLFANWQNYNAHVDQHYDIWECPKCRACFGTENKRKSHAETCKSAMYDSHCSYFVNPDSKKAVEYKGMVRFTSVNSHDEEDHKRFNELRVLHNLPPRKFIQHNKKTTTKVVKGKKSSRLSPGVLA